MIEFKSYASGSSGNLYKVSNGETSLLIECGLRWSEIQEALDFKTSELSGVLLSHSHKDHSRSVKECMKAELDVYMSEAAAVEIGMDNHLLYNHRLKIIEAGLLFGCGPFWIYPFLLEHDVQNFGYLISSGSEKLVYITDSFYCRYRFTGLTIIAIECNYARDILDANVEAGRVDAAMKNRLLQSHFELENVKNFLLANDLSQVRAIHLLHLSDGNSNAERFKREIQAVTGKAVYIA